MKGGGGEARGGAGKFTAAGVQCPMAAPAWEMPLSTQE